MDSSTFVKTVTIKTRSLGRPVWDESGSSSVAYLVSRHRKLGYGERRFGFNTKHQSTKAPKHEVAIGDVHWNAHHMAHAAAIGRLSQNDVLRLSQHKGPIAAVQARGMPTSSSSLLLSSLELSDTQVYEP